MKPLILLGLILMAWSCKTVKPDRAPCFKGRLEIKGACMNYTIKLLEGKLDTTLLVKNWTNESTGKSYSNVFKLGSRCSFPEDILEGQEFYFVLDTTTIQNCAVCMVYYPVPEKQLSIKVLPGACK
jgi:hypothetical protein